MNIVLCGFMGSGKTIVGKELAKITGRKFVDTDEMIEEQQKIAIKEIFATKGEEYFRNLEFDVCSQISGKNNLVVSTGGGALTFERNAEMLKKNGVIVFLDADFDVICDRVGNGETRPLFQDKNKAKSLFNERHSKYENVADIIVDGNMSARKTAMEIASQFK